MSATIVDEGLARLATRLDERAGSRQDASETLAAGARAALPDLSLSDPKVLQRAHEVAEGPEDDLLLPGDLAARVRLLRATLTLKLREAGATPWGSEEAARRIVGRALLRMDGITDLKVVATALHTSRATLVRDAALLGRVDGHELLAELEEAAA